MPRIFDITTTSDTASGDAGSAVRLVFTVTNTTQKAQRGSLRPKALDSGQASWLAVSGEAERDFPPGFTHQVEVSVKVPAGTAPGKFRVRLDALSVANPDDDFTEGPTIGVTVNAGEAPKPKPNLLWLWIAIGVVVLVIIGVVVWMVTRPSDDGSQPPDTPASSPPVAVEVPTGLVGQASAEARKTLEGIGFTVVQRNTNVFDGCADKVISTDPDAGHSPDKGSKVVVNVSALPYGPDTCRQGFVWREAFADDHVCVTPESRSRASQDNQLAASRSETVPGTSKDFEDIQRSNPKSGAVAKGDFFGLARLDSRVLIDRVNRRPLIVRCRAGFYERRARAQDRVCVTEATQLATADENTQADSRKACARP